MDIYKPVFVIGSGRSGTSILFRLLAGHEDFAWISKLTNRYPRYPILSNLNRFTKNSKSDAHPKNQRHPLNPDYESINVYHHIGIRSALYIRQSKLENSDLIPGAKERFEIIIQKHLRGMNKSRFISKNTNNAQRLTYLADLFPDALFIHIYRHPYSVIASLLNVHWWPDLTLWWNGKTPSILEKEGMDPVTIAAQHYNIKLKNVKSDLQHISPDRYLEISYEEIVKNKVRAMKTCLDFINLPYSRAYD